MNLENNPVESTDYSKYYSVPKLDRDIFHWMHPKVIAHIEELKGLANYLMAENRTLHHAVSQFEERMKVIEARLLKDSHNSYKPPSTDVKFKRNQSLRKKSGKKPGGQVGHSGSHLARVPTPDVIHLHPVIACHHCQESLKNKRQIRSESRQVFDLPPLKLRIIEHQIESKQCPCCEAVTQSVFPRGVTAETQYGENLKTFCVYLTSQQLLPYRRSAALCNDLFKTALSSASIVNFIHEIFINLKNIELDIKRVLIHSAVVHFDETPMKVEQKRSYIHLASNERFTHLYAHPNRGFKAVEEIGILPHFKGAAVHDGLIMYFHYHHCSHVLCKPHLLRELKFLEETEKEPWIPAMIACLEELYRLTRVEIMTQPSHQLVLNQLTLYDNIIHNRLSFHASIFPILSTVSKPKRGRKKQRPGKNLLDLFLLRKQEIIGFALDSKLPYSNNQAERDFRMEKVKQKISGCFRSFVSLRKYCRIRSYISSCTKQSHNVLYALHLAMIGKPIKLV